MIEDEEMGKQRSAEEIEENLEQSLQPIDTSREAEEVIEQISRDVKEGRTNEQEERDTSRNEVEDAAGAPSSVAQESADQIERAASVIESTAAEAAALEEDDPAAAQIIERAVSERFWIEDDESFQRPRRLLLDAFLRHRTVPIVERLDAELFLLINERFPHTAALDRFFRMVALAFRNGYAWMAGIALFLPVAPVRVWHILRWTMGAILVTSVIVEQPIKWYFQRRRPFLRIVRSVLIGSRPSSWSFPSGHAAASFAGARALSAFLPRLQVLWYAIAALVGFCRIYLGAHYPSDVAVGAGLGTILTSLMLRLRRGRK